MGEIDHGQRVGNVECAARQFQQPVAGSGEVTRLIHRGAADQQPTVETDSRRVERKGAAAEFQRGARGNVIAAVQAATTAEQQVALLYLDRTVVVHRAADSGGGRGGFAIGAGRGINEAAAAAQILVDGGRHRGVVQPQPAVLYPCV